MGVPSSTLKLPGRRTASPVTVVIREISGLPFTMASWMATTLPTFWQMMPTSSGSPPLGTCLPVRISISCFSPPEGYLVGKETTSIPEPCAAARSAAMASGLLSSTPMSVSAGCSRYCRIPAPAMSSEACSRINTSSAVM